MNENYWRKKYGERNRAFIKGVIAGVEAFAVWKNGKQFVGILKTPLEEEIKNIEKGLGKADPGNSLPRIMAPKYIGSKSPWGKK